MKINEKEKKNLFTRGQLFHNFSANGRSDQDIFKQVQYDKMAQRHLTQQITNKHFTHVDQLEKKKLQKVRQ